MPLRQSTIISFLLLSIGYCNLYAQNDGIDSNEKSDTTYYVQYPADINVRVYFSQKFTGFQLASENPVSSIQYIPNTTRNLGIGFTYKWATLNLAYGLAFINPEKGRGKTKYLDLQSHQYFDKWTIDFYGQFYNGYYLQNPPPNQSQEYVRPDIKVSEIGLVMQYVFNHKKFSFRAAYLNTEYQKKSAGSILVGGNVFYGKITSDSTMLPAFYRNMGSKPIREIIFYKVGPLAGYAYTLVIAKHFYISAALTAHFNLGHYELADEKKSNVYYSTDIGVKSAIGYTSARYNLGIIFIDQTTQMTSLKNNKLETGNVRFILTYRFIPKKELSVFKN